MSSEYRSPFAALPASELPAVEDTKDDSMDSFPSSSDRGRPAVPALTGGGSERPLVLRHDVPGLASSGVIVPQIFTHSVPPADGRARTVSPSFEHRGDSSSSSGPRSYKRRFEQSQQQMLELSQQQNAQFLLKAREAESAWEHENAEKLHLKAEFDCVSAELADKNQFLHYQHETHTAQSQQKVFEMKQFFETEMGRFSAESRRFMEESNRFQAIVAGKDSETQNLGHQLAILQQQQLPPPGVPQDVVTDLLKERDGALHDLQQELCMVHQEKDVLSQEKDVLSQDKNVLSFRVQELEQSLQQLQ